MLSWPISIIMKSVSFKWASFSFWERMTFYLLYYFLCWLMFWCFYRWRVSVLWTRPILKTQNPCKEAGTPLNQVSAYRLYKHYCWIIVVFFWVKIYSIWQLVHFKCPFLDLVGKDLSHSTSVHKCGQWTNISAMAYPSLHAPL